MSLLLTNIERSHYTDRAPWSPYWSDSFVSKVPWYLERNHRSKNLVICYGDSWTWGDSLGNASAAKGVVDSDYRSQHIYASKLADKLEADFINCAIPGIFNYWLHNRLQVLLEQDIERLSKLYDRIWIVVTLTELGRDFEFENYLQAFENFYSLDIRFPAEILVQAEKFDFQQLQIVSNQLPKNVDMYVGRNFTHTFDENKSMLTNLMPDTWSDILFNKQGITNTVKIPMMSFGIDRFDQCIKKKKLDSIEYKKWMSSYILPNAARALDMLDHSVYNNKKATKHPTEQGHTLWADYIYNYIREQQT